MWIIIIGILILLILDLVLLLSISDAESEIKTLKYENGLLANKLNSETVTKKVYQDQLNTVNKLLNENNLKIEYIDNPKFRLVKTKKSSK